MLVAMLLRPCYDLGDGATLSLRFCIPFIQNLKIRYASTTILTLLLRFFCALAISVKIRVILTKISNRSGIAVQWNGGLSSFILLEAYCVGTVQYNGT